MGIKSAIIKTYARRVTRYTAQWSHHALESQEKMMKLLINKASLTQFGKQHNFHKIVTYYDFRHLIPLSRASDLQEFIHHIQQGGKDILWPGRPKYLLHSESDVQNLIPVTKESLPGFYDGLKMLLFNQMDWIDRHKVFKGKILFLTKPHHSHKAGGIHTGNLSWIFTQKIPAWMKGNLIWAEWKTDSNILQKELSKILDQDIRLIVSSPELFDSYCSELSGLTDKKSLKEIFPKLSTVVWNLENAEQVQYANNYQKENEISYLKMFISPIGCWAFQDRLNTNEALLNVNSGLFFEFVELNPPASDTIRRYKLAEVELGIPYKLIMSNNAGCWACDTDLHVRFSELKPFRLEIID